MSAGTKPAKTKHLPQEIQDALKRHRMHPREGVVPREPMRLFLVATELQTRLTYVEGIITTNCDPKKHAWLMLDRAVLVDLTIPNDGVRRFYSKVSESTLAEVQKALDLHKGRFFFVKSDLLRNAMRRPGGSVMEHEMGHLLGVVDHISDVGALMREDSGDWQITDADLTAACSVGPCTGWAPEVAL